MFALDPDQTARVLSAHAIGLALMFGSRARGDAHPGSDCDIAVLALDERPLAFPPMEALRGALQELAGAPIDLVDLATADALLRFEIVREGRLIHADTRERHVDFVARTLIDRDDLGGFVDLAVAGVARAARAGAGG